MYFGERTFQDMQSWQKIIGKTYFQKNERNKDEYRTIYMKYNPFAGKVQAMYSNFVNGNPPDGMEEVNPRLLSAITTMQSTKPEFFQRINTMLINLKLTKVDEAKLREVIRQRRRPFTQADVKQFFMDALNRAYVS